MSYPTPPIKARGFTLIELLTVIAIIGILAAIIIPTVGKVRETARSASAVSNIRQIAIANLAFTEENKGRLEDFEGAPFNRWPVTLAPYAGFQGTAEEISTRVFIQGQRPPGIYAAPGSNYVLPHDGTQFSRALSDFSINLSIFNGQQTLSKLAEMGPSSRMIAFVSAPLRDTGFWVTTDNTTAIPGETVKIINGVWVLYNNNTKGVVAYLGGNAALVNPSELPNSSTPSVERRPVWGY